MGDSSVVGTVAAGVSLIAAAIIILSGEVIVKVAIKIHGAAAATRKVCKGQGLCHGEVGRSFDVCHVRILQGEGRSLWVMVDS